MPLLLIVATGLLALAIFFPAAPSLTLMNTKASPRGGDFTLQGVAGAVSLSQFRGQVVLLYFGYTSCPDICPMSLGVMSTALAQLSEAEQQQLQGIFISVDPGRDSVAILDDYVTYFSPRMLGLTGSADQVAAVARQYGVAYQLGEADASGNYSVDHASIFHLIGRDGELVEALGHLTTPEVLLRQLRQLLAER
ncbi:MAG: SCO family protein [Gammaproteobacteria bacterium]|nr:SCO family protein [Gammaproteobacteria bacterium]